ncbi:hypothetical protein [Cytobacillus dafuensis]|nr:hypothetical protein [Cytobacillus dafuensis]
MASFQKRGDNFFLLVVKTGYDSKGKGIKVAVNKLDTLFCKKVTSKITI